MTSRFAGAGLSALLLYFAYHAFAGEQGLSRWSDLQAEADTLRAELEALELEIAQLDAQIEALKPGQVDPALAEALARQKLVFVQPGELIITH